MIIERRQILFDFVEAHALMCQALKDNRMLAHIVPAALPSHQILGALHTRYFDDVLPDLRNLMRSLVKDMPPEGVIFRIRKLVGGRDEKDTGFVVPEKMMLDLLVGECLKCKIPLPRKAEKKCLTREMYVGFEFKIESGKTAGLELALE
jgi:hypothetical protein